MITLVYNLSAVSYGCKSQRCFWLAAARRLVWLVVKRSLFLFLAPNQIKAPTLLHKPNKTWRKVNNYTWCDFIAKTCLLSEFIFLCMLSFILFSNKTKSRKWLQSWTAAALWGLEPAQSDGRWRRFICESGSLPPSGLFGTGWAFEIKMASKRMPRSSLRNPKQQADCLES